MRPRPLLLVMLALGAGLVASSSAVADSTTATSTTTSTPPTTTTTLKPVPVAPLTGLADPTGVTLHRCAATVKIDNTPEALPQSGLDRADVVYEEIVEGDITRLAAIFNSHVTTMVGPVRSVRRTDREIVYPLGGIFVFSGGAQYALNSIETAPVRLFDQATSGDAMFRDAQRPAPHNLYANLAALMNRCPRKAPPRPLFTYRLASTRAPGPRVASFVVGFENGYAATYTWDARTTSWDRSLFGEPDVAADGVRLSPKNVIVMSVRYSGEVGVIGSAAILTGSGEATVFTGGTVQRGTWSRSSLRTPIVYRLGGRVIAMTPGQTWVELLDTAMPLSITTNQ